MRSASKLFLLAALAAATVSSTAGAQVGSTYHPGRPNGRGYDPFGRSDSDAYPSNYSGLPPQVQRMLGPAETGFDPFDPGWPQDFTGGYDGGRRTGYPRPPGLSPASPLRRDAFGPNRPLVGSAPRFVPASQTREDDRQGPSAVMPVVAPTAVELPRLHHEVSTPHVGTARTTGGRNGGWILGGLGAAAAAVWGFLKWLCGARDRPCPPPAPSVRATPPSVSRIGLGADGKGGVLLRPGPPPRP